MGDSRISLDPMRVLFHLEKDKMWRSLNSRAIAPNLNWIGPNTSESLLMVMEDPESEITVGCVNRQIKVSEMYTKELWKDLALKELKILAEGGVHKKDLDRATLVKRRLI